MRFQTSMLSVKNTNKKVTKNIHLSIAEHFNLFSDTLISKQLVLALGHRKDRIADGPQHAALRTLSLLQSAAYT